MLKKCNSCGKVLNIEKVYCDGCTKEPQKERLTASEAIYGFCAWLTTRKEKTIMSSKDNSAVIAELIALYCETNELKEPRKNYQERLIFPTSK